MTRSLFLAVVFSLLLLGRCFAEQAVYEFRQNYRDGQEFSVLFSRNMDLEFTRTYHGQLVDRRRITDGLQDKARVTILKTADGSRAAERIEVDPASGEFVQWTGQPASQEFNKLAGKTVTVRRNGDGSLSCQLDGDDSPRLARQFRFWLDRDEEIYPDHPVRVREKWDISKKLGDALDLGKDQTVFAFARLDAVQVLKGRPFAKISVSCARQGMLRNCPGLHFELQLEGIAWVDLGTGRVAKMDLSGEVHGAGEAETRIRGGGSAVLGDVAEGKIEYHQLCVAAKVRTNAASDNAFSADAR